MNFSDFIKLLGADPFNRDEETLRARRERPEFEAAARQAEAFEKKLQGAMHIQPPDGLLDDILRLPGQRRRWAPLALAASVLLAVGAAVIVLQQPPRWASVEAYLADHYAHDGVRVVASAVNNLDAPKTERILARFGATAAQPLARHIRFIKVCPTPDGRGAHMVLDTDQGLVTVIFMPHTDVTDGENVSFDDMQALLVSLDHGSAAIIAKAGQSLGDLPDLLRNGLVVG